MGDNQITLLILRLWSLYDSKKTLKMGLGSKKVFRTGTKGQTTAMPRRQQSWYSFLREDQGKNVIIIVNRFTWRV